MNIVLKEYTMKETAKFAKQVENIKKKTQPVEYSKKGMALHKVLDSMCERLYFSNGYQKTCFKDEVTKLVEVITDEKIPTTTKKMDIVYTPPLGATIVFESHKSYPANVPIIMTSANAGMTYSCACGFGTINWTNPEFQFRVATEDEIDKLVDSLQHMRVVPPALKKLLVASEKAQ